MPPADQRRADRRPARCSPRRSTCQGDLDAASYGYGRAGQPDVDGGRGGARRARGRRDACSSPRAWPRCARCWSRRSGPATCSWRATTATPASAAWRADRLAPRGVEVRLVPTDTEAIVAACPGATLVWVETPANPALDVCDIAAVADGRPRRGRAARGRQHARHAARPAPARPRRRRLDAQRDQVALGPLRPDPRRRQRARPRVGRGAARAPLAGRRDRRAVRGLAAAPLAADAGAAARAPERQRAGARAVPARAPRRQRRAPPVPRGPSGPRGRPRARCATRGALVGFALDGAERAQRFLGALELVPRRPASAACTPAPSAAGAGGPTRWPRASSASPRAARTPPTCWPTSRRRSSSS